MGKRGFTLIELLITIAIIGILAAAATTAYIGTTKKAARSEAYSNLESLRLLEEQFFADSGDYTISLGTCAKDNPANVDVIKTGGGDPTNALPGFKPGTSANFSYCIVNDEDIAGNDTSAAVPPYPCFTASAYGDTDTRVDDDVFMIDCNNDRTF